VVQQAKVVMVNHPQLHIQVQVGLLQTHQRSCYILMQTHFVAATLLVKFVHLVYLMETIFSAQQVPLMEVLHLLNGSFVV